MFFFYVDRFYLKKKDQEEDKKGQVREILSESLEGFAERKVKELPIFIGRLGIYSKFFLFSIPKIILKRPLKKIKIPVK